MGKWLWLLQIRLPQTCTTSIRSGGAKKFSELPYQGLPCLQDLGDSTVSPISQKTASRILGGNKRTITDKGLGYGAYFSGTPTIGTYFKPNLIVQEQTFISFIFLPAKSKVSFKNLVVNSACHSICITDTKGIVTEVYDPFDELNGTTLEIKKDSWLYLQNSYHNTGNQLCEIEYPCAARDAMLYEELAYLNFQKFLGITLGDYFSPLQLSPYSYEVLAESTYVVTGGKLQFGIAHTLYDPTNAKSYFVTKPIKLSAGQTIIVESEGTSGLVNVAVISLTDKDSSFYAPIRVDISKGYHIYTAPCALYVACTLKSTSERIYLTTMENGLDIGKMSDLWKVNQSLGFSEGDALPYNILPIFSGYSDVCSYWNNVNVNLGDIWTPSRVAYPQRNVLTAALIRMRKGEILFLENVLKVNGVADHVLVVTDKTNKVIYMTESGATSADVSYYAEEDCNAYITGELTNLRGIVKSIIGWVYTKRALHSDVDDLHSDVYTDNSVVWKSADIVEGSTELNYYIGSSYNRTFENGYLPIGNKVDYPANVKEGYVLMDIDLIAGQIIKIPRQSYYVNNVAAISLKRGKDYFVLTTGEFDSSAEVTFIAPYNMRVTVCLHTKSIKNEDDSYTPDLSDINIQVSTKDFAGELPNLVKYQHLIMQRVFAGKSFPYWEYRALSEFDYPSGYYFNTKRVEVGQEYNPTPISYTSGLIWATIIVLNVGGRLKLSAEIKTNENAANVVVKSLSTNKVIEVIPNEDFTEYKALEKVAVYVSASTNIKGAFIWDERSIFDIVEKDVDAKINEALEEISSDVDDLTDTMFNSFLFIGDSVTDGHNVDSDLGVSKVIDELSYPKFLGKQWSWATMNNQAIAGYTIQQAESIILPKCTCEEQVCVIELGWNLRGGDQYTTFYDTYDTDVAPYDSYNDYADTNMGIYCKMIEEILEKNPNMLIILVCSQGWGNSSTNRTAAVRRIAKEYDLPLIDFTDERKYPLNYRQYSDGVHSTAYGYALKAKYFIKGYKEALHGYIQKVNECLYKDMGIISQ